MIRVAQGILAAVLCSAASLAVAGGLWLQQADGKLLAVVDDGSAGPYQQQLERRKADGNLDLGFGRGGRVSFSLGTESLGPRALQIDTRGRLLVIGTAFGPNDLAAPAIARFLPDGRADASWGVQGRSLALSPVPATDALGVDVLGLADDSVLLLGQIESPAGQRAALWRLRGDGRADTDFGLGGVLLSSALDRAQPLGLLRDDGDAALIAVRVVSQGANWLEVHRWQPGQGELQLVARQPAPREWRGPVSLERRGGTLQWFDAGTTSGLPLATTGATNAATDSAAVTAPSLGNAGFNPFAVDDKPSNRTFEVQDDIVPWLGWAGGLLAAVLGVVAWHLRRSSVTDLGMLDTRTAQVEAAVRHLHAAPRPNTMVHKGMADAPRTARLAEPIRSDTAESAPGAISLADPADASPRLDHSETPSGLTPTRSTSVSVPVSGGDGCHNRLPRPAFGEPDNLKKIKGVGPVLEKMLHAEGTYYFWQVAEWAQADVAHVSSRMPSFKGRIERDAWVAQAAELACRPDSARKPQT